MPRKQKTDPLEKILNYPGVTHKKINQCKYLIQLYTDRWYLWPRTGRFKHLYSDDSESEVFFCKLNNFYHRFMTAKFKPPKNFGKEWQTHEEDLIFDLINEDFTMQQIADELERHTASVATRLDSLLTGPASLTDLTDEEFNIPVKDLLGWD
ncbi:hypothetical protein [Pelagibaculum spongiae]|uniref:Uncharacterized protein n=1 Tax=Pelagibaculum spongiae TaxID=2080658 RepID=A0A2V1GZI0_9GAMM|nr:hypothetical protein [Pelagibaculum spongiae]PVZ66770.1 hypothetical protein DC094_16025 [Pelagibaculum spongiae]